MNKLVLTAVISSLLIAFNSGCGLQIFQDWQNSDGKAMVGGGAIAGADYVNGLLPSEGAKEYFAKIPATQKPIETVSRHDDTESKTGVRFVKNGGIVIPPGVTISYTNKGYCMDPHLPAPIANEEYQLVPMTRLIPPDLQGTYKKLLTKAANGDLEVQRNMQHLVWALRTAGSKDAYANNLTAAQKKILDRCSDYQGQFEEYHINSRKNQEQWGALLGLADTVLNVQIGGVTYKASDLLDPDVGSKKINAHMEQLISMGKSTPVERTGLNFGEIQSGIYTDVRGAGTLAYTAKIANSTEMDFIFFPSDYVGQVGSGIKSNKLTFFYASNTAERQRVTTGNPDSINICHTPSGEVETVTIDYRSRWKTCASPKEAREEFEKEAIRLGANQNCVEVHAAIITDSGGKTYLTEPKITRQQTVKNADGTYSAINRTRRENIPRDAQYIENIHTHWGDSPENHQPSAQDNASKANFNATIKDVNNGYRIFNATTGRWIPY